MTRTVTMTLTTAALSILCFGCLGRIFQEGKGATHGASGRVVESGAPTNFGQYKSLEIEAITVAPGLQTPGLMADMIRADLAAVALKRGMGQGGQPGLRLTGEIIHYETGTRTDAVTSPLEEVVVRSTLIDVQSGDVVGETNLIGRSKASSSSGDTKLSEGVGKALDKWLEGGGLAKAGDDD